MSRERHELQEAADDLDKRWNDLDLRRFTGRELGADDSRPGKPRLHLAEYQALWGLEEASVNRANRPSLVRNAIRQLDAAYHQAVEADSQATRRVAGRRLAECLRAYRTLPMGTVPLSNLNAAGHAAWVVLQDTSIDYLTETLVLRCALGEFFKEAYTSHAMRVALSRPELGIVETEDDDDSVFLDLAFRVLDPVRDLLVSGKLLERHHLTSAAASVRHLAVVHEFHYFRPDCPPGARDNHLREWLRLSVDAAAVCADQEEFNTQGYALLNKAAALAELTASDGINSQLQTLTESSDDVRRAQDLFALTSDDRGLAWSGIHLARICARQYELSEKSSTEVGLGEILRRMLETSIDAESNSRRIDDEVAQGLASLYLCAAEKEAQRVNLEDLSISDEPEIAERARLAADVLSSTHRLPQAARALQIAAQCELVMAGRTESHVAAAESRVRAMGDLTAAIAILDDNGDLDRKASERLIANLHESVAAAVPRWRF